MEKISFIIPIYNVKVEELDNCLKSIVNQNWQYYEIILVNDGDNNQALIDYCSRITNKNIKYLYQKNAGSAVARNNGLDNCTGKYIMFVDSDDILTPNLNKELEKIFKMNKDIDFAIFDYSIYDLSNEEIHTLKVKDNLYDSKVQILSNIMFYPNCFNDFMFGSIWAKIFNISFLKKNNIKFKPELRKAQDRMFMLEVINKSNNILYFPIYSYKYKSNNNSICHKLNYKMIDYYKKLYSNIIDYKEKNSLDDSIFKFVEYNIVNEILPLCIFHRDNNIKYIQKRREFLDLYNYFDLRHKTNQILYSDIPTLKGKIKLFLYRYKFIFLLYMFFVMKQNHKFKSIFK